MDLRDPSVDSPNLYCDIFVKEKSKVVPHATIAEFASSGYIFVEVCK